MRPFLEVVEFDKYISPDGEVYNFHDGYDHFIAVPADSQGLPDIDYKTQRGPFQHGETLIDYFLRPRVIQLAHRRQGRSRQDYWDNRADLLDHVRPNRDAALGMALGNLVKILPDGSERYIDVLIQEGPKFGAQSPENWDHWAFTEVLRFIAFDPTFYDPEEQTVLFALSSLSHLVFPVQLLNGDPGDVDMLFFTANVTDNQDVRYEGTWRAFPIITITGPADGLQIDNNTTGKTIALSYNIADGETVTIDLRYGKKTIVNQLGTKLIGTLDTDSDLSDFYLAPDPIAPSGVNNIGVTFSSANANSSVSLAYYTRFIGI